MSLRLKNRPEINGLRALAVLSVVIYILKLTTMVSTLYQVAL